MGVVPAPAAPPLDDAESTPPAAVSLRQQALRFVLAAALTVALLTPPALLIGRPPSAPQLTVIGTASGNEGALSLLLEGAGGGRVLIGGGASGADLPAALARTAPPWRDRLDLLLIADARDLPGATELVRRGRVGQVATVGLTNERAALVALRDLCAVNGVPLRAIGAGERIAVGQGGALTLDVRPGVAGEAPALSLTGGGFSAAIVMGADAPLGASSVAIVPRGTSIRIARRSLPGRVCSSRPPRRPAATPPRPRNCCSSRRASGSRSARRARICACAAAPPRRSSPIRRAEAYRAG